MVNSFFMLYNALFNSDGWTPLYEAGANGHVEVVRELLKHSAELESKTKDGWTPL